MQAAVGVSELLQLIQGWRQGMTSSLAQMFFPRKRLTWRLFPTDAMQTNGADDRIGRNQ